MTTKAKPAPFAVSVRHELTSETVANLLCSALEGGTGYWAQIDNADGPEYHANKCDEIAAGRGHLLIIEVDGGDDARGKVHRLDRAALARGLEIMARDYPRHMADLISEGDDATTGDVFMQCALLGKVVYG